MRRLAAIGALVWALCLTLVGCTPTVDGVALGPHLKRAAGPREPGLLGLLLALDEMKQLLRFPTMAKQFVLEHPDANGVFRPANCVGALFSSMARTYDGSGYRDFYEVRYSDPSGTRVPHWVDQGVATFGDDSTAKAFAAKEIGQWRQCAGQRIEYAYPRAVDRQGDYHIGDPIDSGCVTLLSNVYLGDHQYVDFRALAAKSNVVVDLQFTGFDLTDEPATAVSQILDRIAEHGQQCAFWA
jgi:PknH-like extracellular domain